MHECKNFILIIFKKDKIYLILSIVLHTHTHTNSIVVLYLRIFSLLVQKFHYYRNSILMYDWQIGITKFISFFVNIVYSKWM